MTAEVARLLPQSAQSVPVVAETIQEVLTNAEGMNQTCVAVLKNGYYEVNGFKFSEYYYKKLWNSGRGAPSLSTQIILEEGKLIGPDIKKTGFFRYETIDWELIYNPTTHEIWHMRPITKK